MSESDRGPVPEQRLAALLRRGWRALALLLRRRAGAALLGLRLRLGGGHGSAPVHWLEIGRPRHRAIFIHRMTLSEPDTSANRWRQAGLTENGYKTA